MQNVLDYKRIPSRFEANVAFH